MAGLISEDESPARSLNPSYAGAIIFQETHPFPWVERRPGRATPSQLPPKSKNMILGEEKTVLGRRSSFTPQTPIPSP
jgi:hypothetical protein